MLNDLNRSARAVGLSLLALVSLPIIIWAAMHVSIILNSNPGYAAAVFEPILPGTTTLESKRYHGFGDGGWACTYAIVALPDTAPTVPPAFLSPPHWQLRFGGTDWMPTPMSELGDTTRDALGECGSEWNTAVRQRIEKAITLAGSFVIVGSVGETVYVYSKPQGIAARVRYGD